MRQLLFESLEARKVLATVNTDLLDYSPADWAHVYANDFQPGEAIEFQVTHVDGVANTGAGHLPWTVFDGGEADLDGLVNGSVRTAWYVNPDDSAGSQFELTATGLASNQTAATRFSEASQNKFGQFANQPDNFEYVVGSLNQNNSEYTEGASVPYRFFIENAAENGALTLSVYYHATSGTHNAQDFLTSDNASEMIGDAQRFGPAAASLFPDFDFTTCVNSQSVPIPDDPSIPYDDPGLYPGSRNFFAVQQLSVHSELGVWADGRWRA